MTKSDRWEKKMCVRERERERERKRKRETDRQRKRETRCKYTKRFHTTKCIRTKRTK